MDILALLETCHKNYSRDGQCSDCQNSDCRDLCVSCLDSIHMNKIKRRYNCQNIVNCYVCKYQLKYSSEIYHLLNNHRAFDNLQDVNVCSIGCGPCSDLFAIANWMQRKKKQNLTYYGFDLNNEWTPIQNEVRGLASGSPINIQAKIFNKDIFAGLKWLDILPLNILVMQYVISDIILNCENAEMFLNKIVEKIITQMSNNSFVIINDINHDTRARNYFEYLYRLLKGQNNIIFSRFHFVNKNRNFWPYGSQHSSNSLIWNVPQFCNFYDPWLFCSSAQLVIQKV